MLADALASKEEWSNASRGSKQWISELGPMAGTLMAVDPNAPKVNRFITLGGEPYLIRYNSRLPIVVYAPEGVEVRYQEWSAAPQAKAMDKG
jgi:ecotin